LQGIITTGLQKNFDVLVTYARIDQAMASFKVARAQVWPVISASGTAAAYRQALPGGTASEYQSYYATAGLTWELDIWGKARRGKEAEKAKLFASRAFQQSVMITLVADLAMTYFDLLELDNELLITRENIRIREQSLALVKAKMIAGTASGLVVAQAEAELASAKTEIPTLEMQVGLTEDALNILMGNIPGTIIRGRPMLDQLHYPDVIVPGTITAMILRRPDIMESEQQLIAANANIGVARASMLPTLGISADIGAAFIPTNLIYSAIGNLVAPIFGAGRLRAGVKLAQAQKEEMLLTYQKTIYTSLQEVSDALLEVDKQKQITYSQTDLVAAAQTNFDLSNQLYYAGYANYLDVLDAQRKLFSAQISLSQSQDSELDAFVKLYKALGGGWK
jgi:multidrug efflux system outer membrane protein